MDDDTPPPRDLHDALSAWEATRREIARYEAEIARLQAIVRNRTFKLWAAANFAKPAMADAGPDAVFAVGAKTFALRDGAIVRVAVVDALATPIKPREPDDAAPSGVDDLAAATAAFPSLPGPLPAPAR